MAPAGLMWSVVTESPNIPRIFAPLMSEMLFNSEFLKNGGCCT